MSDEFWCDLAEEDRIKDARLDALQAENSLLREWGQQGYDLANHWEADNERLREALRQIANFDGWDTIRQAMETGEPQPTWRDIARLAVGAEGRERP